MSIHKVIEVISQSEKSWDDAAQKAVDEASQSVRGIKSVYVKNMEAIVKDNKVTHYRINAKITFEIEA